MWLIKGLKGSTTLGPKLRCLEEDYLYTIMFIVHLGPESRERNCLASASNTSFNNLKKKKEVSEPLWFPMIICLSKG